MISELADAGQNLPRRLALPSFNAWRVFELSLPRREPVTNGTPALLKVHFFDTDLFVLIVFFFLGFVFYGFRLNNSLAEISKALLARTTKHLKLQEEY